MFLVATNAVASRPPERRPTGTPTARANTSSWSIWSIMANFFSILEVVFHKTYTHSEKLRLWYGIFFNNYNSYTCFYDIFNFLGIAFKIFLS